MECLGLGSEGHVVEGWGVSVGFRLLVVVAFSAAVSVIAMETLVAVGVVVSLLGLTKRRYGFWILGVVGVIGAVAWLFLLF